MREVKIQKLETVIYDVLKIPECIPPISSGSEFTQVLTDLKHF